MINDDFAGVGIDYDKGLEIFMGNRELYMGLEMGDFAMAEKAACTLKGIAGNLGMTDLSAILEKMILALMEGKDR